VVSAARKFEGIFLNVKPDSRNFLQRIDEGQRIKFYSGFSDKLKTAALWAAQKTSGRMIQRQNHSAEKLFCQKLSEFYSDFECLMAYNGQYISWPSSIRWRF